MKINKRHLHVVQDLDDWEAVREQKRKQALDLIEANDECLVIINGDDLIHAVPFVQHGSIDAMGKMITKYLKANTDVADAILRKHRGNYERQ